MNFKYKFIISDYHCAPNHTDNRGHLFIRYHLTLKLSPLPTFTIQNTMKPMDSQVEEDILANNTFLPGTAFFTANILGKRFFLPPVTHCNRLYIFFSHTRKVICSRDFYLLTRFEIRGLGAKTPNLAGAKSLRVKNQVAFATLSVNIARQSRVNESITS